MLEKSRNAVFFQWFVCRVSQKVGSLKRRLRSHVVRGEIKNCTPLWREAHFQSKCASRYMFGPLFEVAMLKNGTPLWREAHFEVKMYKTPQLRTTFWSWDVEKWHAAVARSTFWSENAKKTQGFGPLFEVEMFKNCTPLWREAHFQVNMYKTLHSRTTFWSCDVEKLHAAVARSTFPSQNVKKLTVSEHFLKFRCRKISQVVS